MGTVAEKLSYLADTKDLFRDRLNSLGAEITSSTTFRNYLNWLDAFYGEISDKTDLSINGVVGRTSQNTAILPSEYTQVDYIESSDTQYIDTGVNADNKLDIKYILEKTSSITSGAIYNDNGNYTRYHIGTNNNKYSFFILNNSTFTTINDDTNVKHEFYIKATNRTISVDGITYEMPEATATDTGLNFWIFRRNSNSTNLRNYSAFKLYSCSIYYNNELVRDFIPCYRNSDNEVGLYDIVNNVFYTNQGTGVFTYGAVVSIPNLDYPQPINNLSGNVSYKVSGKNLWNITDYRNANITNNGRTTHSTTADKIIINTGNTRYEGVYLKQVYQNIDNYNAQNEYYVSFDAVANQDLTFLYGESGGVQNETTIGTQKVRLSQKYDPTKNLIFYSTSERENDTIEISNIKISTSNDTTYEPYIEPRTFNIPLGDIELCKIDTYEDKIYSSNGRFYLSKNTDKYTYKGTENWNISTNFYVAVPTNYAYTNNIPFSNYFKGIINQAAANAIPTDVDNVIAVKNRYGDPRVYIRATRFQNVNELKQWLSTHNTTLYYGTLNTTTTEITQENYPSLYNALKQIQDYLTAYKINKEFILGYSSPEIEY